MEKYYICKGCLDRCYVRGKDIPTPSSCLFQDDTHFTHWVVSNKSDFYKAQGLGEQE